MESVKTVRAVERAFEVLRALQGMPQGATLVELQGETGLSGPTLLRMLKTLIAVKAVRRSTIDQRYRNTMHLLGRAPGAEPAELLADVAAPWLDQLCRRVEWPSDLAIHRGNEDFMSVLESTLRQSRFYVRRSRGGVRVNLLGSAAGTAFLAAITARRRQEIVEAARGGRDVHNARIIAVADLEQRVQDVRRRGYASRHPVYRGGSYDGEPRDDALNAVAVPVVAAGRVLGALNINWNRTAMTEREMVRRNLAALQEAAHGIAAAAKQELLRQLSKLEQTDALF